MKSNPTLCLTGPQGPLSNSVTIEKCLAGNALQQFTFVDSILYPYSTIFQGDKAIGVAGNSVIFEIEESSTQLTACDSSKETQHISYTGSSSAPGQLKVAGNRCVSGACSSGSGCYPMPFVPCNSSDDSQLFQLTSSNALVIQSNGYCIDAYYFTV